MALPCVDKSLLSDSGMMVPSMWKKFYWCGTSDPSLLFCCCHSQVIGLFGKIGNNYWACRAQLCPFLTWSSTTCSGCINVFNSGLFGFHAKLCPLIKPYQERDDILASSATLLLYALNYTKAGALWCCLLGPSFVMHEKAFQTFCTGLDIAPMCLHSSVCFLLASS